MKSKDKSNSSPDSRNVRSKAKLASGSSTIRYFSTFRNTIDDVLASRGWQEVQEGEEFDIVWADREWVTFYQFMIFSNYKCIKFHIKISNFHFNKLGLFGL